MAKMRKAIIFDGSKWHVRHIRAIEEDLDRGEKVYRCDQPLSNDHATLAEVPEVKSLLQIGAQFVQPRISELQIALRESVKLQAHYAELLNMHDGGLRMIFPTPEEWIARLRKTGAIA
jgi:hypothetical protein